MSNQTRWPATVHPRAMSMGILLSLILHFGLMQLFWHQEKADIAPPHSSRKEIALLLLPTAPVARVVTPPVVQRGARPIKSPIRANTMTRTLPSAPQENSMNEVAIKPQPTDKQTRVDLDAAFKTARKIAIDPNERRNGPAVAQLQTHPLEARQSDSRLAQDIQRGARVDCLDVGRPFGLLAPLVLVADTVLSKKDSGCKW